LFYEVLQYTHKMEKQTMGLFNNSDGFGNLNDFVSVQTQDTTGNWRTINLVPNYSQNILFGMQQLNTMFPDQRTRVVDSDGRIVDIM